jgi:hypothetical protein
MTDGVHMGPAYAWQDDSGQWLYSPFKAVALPHAVEVERYSADDRIVLYWHRTGPDGSLYIWDAAQVD